MNLAAHDNLNQHVGQHGDDRSFLQGKIQRQEVKPTLNGKGERDDHPAMVFEDENKKQKKTSACKNQEGHGIPA